MGFVSFALIALALYLIQNMDLTKPQIMVMVALMYLWGRFRGAMEARKLTLTDLVDFLIKKYLI